jgi:hypothetical protein
MTTLPPKASFPLAQPKLDEPWVDLPNAQAFESWTKPDEVAYNQANRQIEKYRFFVKAFDFIQDVGLKGDYHEYGCHRVRTFRMALTEARRHFLDHMKFWAFDSFAGLPDSTSNPSHPLWNTAGALTTTEDEFRAIVERHGIYADRVTTVKGFYDKTLTAERTTTFLDNEAKISLACIDCDLYESAVPVFNFIEPLLQEGSLLYLDDIFVGYKGSPHRGVARAFLEFQKRSRFKFIRHMDVGWWGRSYITYLPDSSVPDGVL